MLPSRSFLQTSIRGMAIAIAVMAIGLAVFVNGAMRQRAAVNAIEAGNGRVLYDFHKTQQGDFDPNASSPLPQWLLSWLGVDYWHPVIFVDLDSPTITNDSLDLLSGFPRLEILHISNASITNEGLSKLKELTQLHTLTLNSDGINDSALVHIRALPALTTLEFHGTTISDEGIVSLDTMKRLKKLWLDESKVSERGINRLREALPNCKIEW
jgi:hypothetical protein